jgi:hypothetical protein
MFENAQQEPSGGTTKLIGGVLLVAIVIMVGVWFAFFRGATPAESPSAAPAAAASAANTPAPDADHRRDIVIIRSTMNRDQSQTMAVWDVQVSNRSREITYRNIKYTTSYYDNGGNLIQQGTGTLPDELAPGEQRNFGGINDGLYPLATARYGIEFTGADGFKP